MRDVLNIPIIDPESLDATSFTWLNYITMGDEEILKEQIEKESPTNFWLNTLKISLNDSRVLIKLVTLLKSKTFGGLADINDSMEETLVAALIYVGKYDQAYAVFKDLLSNKKETNYALILEVCLCLNHSIPLEVLQKIHEEQGKSLYQKIIPHLLSLKLNINYIHKWNNILVSNGDFPKASSAPMNPIFKTMIESENFRSFDNCLRSVAKHLKNHSGWIDKETSRYISKLIICSTSQQPKLHSLVSLYGVESFPKEFYFSLYARTRIDPTFLNFLLGQIGIDKNDPDLIEANVKSLSQAGDMQKFWNYIEKHADKIQSPKILIRMLSMHLKESRTLRKSFDFAIHILETYPNYKHSVVNTFILQRVNKTQCEFGLVESILEFERYLKENGYFDDKIQNSFIYADLRLLRIRSALERIQLLLSNPESFIDSSTIRNTQLILSRRFRRIPEDFLEEDEIPAHFIVKTVLRMQKHNKDCTMSTWNSILLQAVKAFTNTASEQFLLEVADHISLKSKLNLNPANPCHPLMQVFNDQLITQIIINGFLEPKRPWCGLETLVKLQAKGIFISKSHVKLQILKLMRRAGLTISEKQQLLKKDDSTVIPSTELDYEVVLGRINELQAKMM